jgi:hypothetical protein
MATIHDLTRVGLTARQADHWTRRGWLHADNADCGTGYQRTWPDSEVRVAATMAVLTRAGLVVPAAERVARGGDLAPGIRVVVDQGCLLGPSTSASTAVHEDVRRG